MNEILQKRIEEAADEYQNLVIEETKCHHNHTMTYAQGYEDARLLVKPTFIDAADWLLQNQWISVDEALPEENGWYLTLNTKSTSPNFADTCQWNAKGKYWYTELCGDVFLHERTHWMPIPSLKGGERCVK